MPSYFDPDKFTKFRSLVRDAYSKKLIHNCTPSYCKLSWYGVKHYFSSMTPRTVTKLSKVIGRRLSRYRAREATRVAKERATRERGVKALEDAIARLQEA